SVNTFLPRTRVFPAMCQLSYAVDCDASRRNSFVWISHIADTRNPVAMPRNRQSQSDVFLRCLEGRPCHSLDLGVHRRQCGSQKRQRRSRTAKKSSNEAERQRSNERHVFSLTDPRISILYPRPPRSVLRQLLQEEVLHPDRFHQEKDHLNFFVLPGKEVACVEREC